MAQTLLWSSSPDQDRPPTFSVVRTRAGQTNRAVCLSSNLLGAEVHYCARTVPHTEPAEECEGCRAKRTKRWEGYFLAWNPTTGRTSIGVVTANAAVGFENYAKVHGTIRGAMVTLSRPAGRANGRLAADLAPSGLPAPQLPAELDLRRTLGHIWGLSEHVVQQVATSEAIPAGLLDTLAHDLAEVPGFPSGDDESASSVPAPHVPLPGQSELQFERRSLVERTADQAKLPNGRH